MPTRTKKGNQGISPEQSAHMRQFIRSKLLSRIQQTQLAAMLGVPHGNFSYFLNETRGGTMSMAFRVAYLLSCPVEDVLGMPRAPTFVDEEEDRYPTRVLAARAAYLEGVSAERIQSALTALLKSGGGESDDPGFEWWMKLMRTKSLGKPGSIKDTTRAKALMDAGSAKANLRARVKARTKRRTNG
jgi:plasmid maintenance system antidote protein VapI